MLLQIDMVGAKMIRESMIYCFKITRSNLFCIINYSIYIPLVVIPVNYLDHIH